MLDKASTVAQYLGGADNVHVIEAFARTQKKFDYDFGEDVTGWVFTADYQSILLDTVTYNSQTGIPDLSNTSVLGYFNNYKNLSTLPFNVTNASTGAVEFTIPANRYSGFITPHATNNVVITVVSVQWNKADGDRDSHRIAVIERWEPGVTIGNPAEDPLFTLDANSEIGSLLSNLLKAGVSLNDTHAFVGYWDGIIEELFAYDTNSKSQLYTINNPSASEPSYFGFSIASDNNYVIVGDYQYTYKGRVYIYDLSGNLIHTLEHPAPINGDRFGYSVAIDGNYVIVGSPYDTTTSTRAGSVYVYNVTTGALIGGLPFTSDMVPTLSLYEAFFGHSVAVYGNYAVVGAIGVNVPNVHSDAGAVFVYDLTTLSLVYSIFGFEKPNPNGPLFGISVDITEDYIIVGSTQARAYVYDKITGTHVRTLVKPGDASFGGFGRKVAIFGSSCVISDPYYTDVATNTGRVFVYDVASGDLVQTINDPSPSQYNNFGWDISFNGTRVLISSVNSGVYMYNLYNL